MNSISIQKILRYSALFLLVALMATPAISAEAAPKTPALEFSGWMPYWRTATSTADVLPHLSSLTEVNPFGYTVKKDGTLYDALNIGQPAWQSFIKAAKAKEVRVVPTVMWSDTDAMHTILSSTAKRTAHVKAIVSMVTDGGFAGVDIDYEGKSSADIDNFSAFLKQLRAALPNKALLECTIEARTPAPARYTSSIPSDAYQYANDYKAINTYCDRVRVMTYDQLNVDVVLNAANAGKLYAPVADPLWVEKVLRLAMLQIDKSKIVLGVGTYGYINEVQQKASGTGYLYSRLEAFNPKYATDLAASLGIVPTRNSAGELNFSYTPTTTPASLSLGKPGTKPFYLLDWSDSKSIADKVALAKKLGIRGVAVFKFDGGEDQNMWAVLK